MKVVTVKLPDDLEAKLSEVRGERSINAVVVDALREFWFPRPKDVLSLAEEHAVVSDYPAWGSIPAERKYDA